MTGQELLGGRYQLRGLLGCGGMAEVRDGWDSRLDRPVAVKLLHSHLNADLDIRRRFDDEARSAAALSHPNIVAVHDFGVHDSRPFIVMERLPGRTLADVMSEGPMSPVHVRSVLDDVLAALAVAHSAGVLHRDIKPANILVSSSGDGMKVADFGIAKSGGAAHTTTGQIIGTLCYMSPERVAGAPASVADDLYAVGIMGYEALLARRAFPQDNPAALARAILDAPPPPRLNEMQVEADPVLAEVIDRAMSRDYRNRFGSAEQMRAALAGNADALYSAVPAAAPPRPVTMVLPSPLAPSAVYLAPPPPPSRARRYLAAAAVLAAFAIAAVALAMEPFSSPAPIEPVSTSTTAAPPPPATTPPPPPPAPTAASLPPPIQQPAQNAGEEEKGEDKKGERGEGNNGRGNGNGGNKDKG